MNNGLCHMCQKPGHIAAYCPNKAAVAAGTMHMGVNANAGGVSRGNNREKGTQMPLHRQHEKDKDPNQRGHSTGDAAAGHSHALVSDIIPAPDACAHDAVASRQDRVSEPRSSAMAHSGERRCRCGRCGECTQQIDVLEKEAKVGRGCYSELAPAREERARAVEEETKRWLQQAEEWEQRLNLAYRPEQLSFAMQNLLMSKEEIEWQQSKPEREEEGEDAPAARKELVQATVEGEPERVRGGLRRALQQQNSHGKKSFDKFEEARQCGFCRRKGHTHATCMIRQERVSDGKGGYMYPMRIITTTTELQSQKQAFVLGLMNREKAQSVREIHEQRGGTRLEAVQEVMRRGEEANKGNPWRDSEKRRDRLRKQLGVWWAIGADATTLSWIGFGVQLRFEREPERKAFRNHPSYFQEHEHIDEEHRQHVQDGSFREAQGWEVHVGNPVQVEVNAKGKRRMCVDMRFTNSGLADYQFTQEGLAQHVSQIITRDMLMITTDVTKAYYQVPLHKDSQKYCAWQHKGQWIVPTIIVFGLSPAPFIFTKIMRVPLTFARSIDIRGTNCIDDNLWAAQEKMMEEVKRIVLLLFVQLGWTLNDKCALTPSTLALYNGMWIDSARFEIRATDEKVELARKLAWKLWFAVRDGGVTRMKDLQVLTGRLQSMKLALEGVAVWTRGLYTDMAKTNAAHGERARPSEPVPLS